MKDFISCVHFELGNDCANAADGQDFDVTLCSMTCT